MNAQSSLTIRFIAGCVACLLAASTARAQSPSSRAMPKAAQQTNAAPSVSNDYRLAPNDVVYIKVFQEEELETNARIARNGSITFPLIKTASIGGLTRREAEERIETLLREYLKRPQVTVRIIEYTKRRYTVLGQVNNPGAFELPDDETVDLLEAIGTAGGFSRIANPSKITVKRKVDGREVTHKLDGKKMANEPDNARFEILPGDTIFVGESFL